MSVDIVEEWETIRKWLREDASSIQNMRKLIREHSDITERAKNISIVANTQYKDYLIRYNDRRQLWRVQALKFWESQKSAGLSKQITESMLDDWMIENHSELYMELQRRKIHLEEICERLDSLVTLVNARGSDLRKLLESETRRPVTPNWIDTK
jgi:hypothetical protein